VGENVEGFEIAAIKGDSLTVSREGLAWVFVLAPPWN
jgi:hypothetical protein